jgi:DNA-binding beta-propeller fold protein YncE
MIGINSQQWRKRLPAFVLAMTIITPPVLFTESIAPAFAEQLRLPLIVNTVKTGAAPQGIAFNNKTNRVYIRNRFGDSIQVLDGSTDQVLATIPDPRLDNSVGIAVDKETNRVYAQIFAYDAASGIITQSLLEIDGRSNSVVNTIFLDKSGGASFLGVFTDVKINAKTHKAYLPVFYGNWGGVKVVDLRTRKIVASIPFNDDAGVYSYFIAINETTNKIYVDDEEAFEGKVTSSTGAPTRSSRPSRPATQPRRMDASSSILTPAQVGDHF